MAVASAVLCACSILCATHYAMYVCAARMKSSLRSLFCCYMFFLLVARPNKFVRVLCPTIVSNCGKFYASIRRSMMAEFTKGRTTFSVDAEKSPEHKLFGYAFVYASARGPLPKRFFIENFQSSPSTSDGIRGWRKSSALRLLY